MTGRELPPTSAFAADDGSADPGLAAALGAYAARPGSGALQDVVTALGTARVLVPVLAHLELGDTTEHGLQVDKEASAGIVALRVPDGRTAMPVFSSVDALARWRAQARPVPAQAPRAAASALQEGWELLVVDPGGPAPVQVPHPAVRAIAAGQTWTPAVVDGPDGAVVGPVVGVAIPRAVGRLSQVAEVVARPGRSAEVAVELQVRPGLTRSALDELLREVGQRLAADGQVTALVDSLELRVVAAG